MENAIMFRKSFLVTLAVLFLVCASACISETGLFSKQKSSLTLPSILGDHMVLQQGTNANIWGWADPGAKVKVTTSWNDLSYRTRSDQDGNWMVEVETCAAGGPYDISIKADTTIVLSDILLGEVWVCSGQSNMAWTLSQAESAAKEIPNSANPNIRLFTVKQRISACPVEDVKGNWSVCEPENAGNFSAVGYFFGKNVQESLKVPIGLINTSWGGTPSESWTSKEALQGFGDFKDQLDQLYNVSDEEMDKVETRRNSIDAALRNQEDIAHTGNAGFREDWIQSDYDDSGWIEADCPAEWSTLEEVGMLEGVIWMRTKFHIPIEWIGKSLMLELGPIDELDVTFFNGQLVGSSTKMANWYKDRNYKISGSLVTKKECILAIRVVNAIGGGGIFGQPEQLKIYPEGMEDAYAVLLAGTWKYQIADEFPPISLLGNPHTPSVLYNGMLHPLQKFAIKGAIWYQGESNVNRAMQYRELFPVMISDWRHTWGRGDFPFYFVQLAPYNYGSEFTSAELREAQFLTLSKLKKTGMAVTLDIGNPDDIHPTNKRDVGRRLALWALANDYERELVHSGPLYKKLTIEDDKIRIHFEHVGSGLEAREGSLTFFEVAGEDQVYHPAEAIIDRETVVVSSPAVSAPVAVRYGWRNTAEPNLFNKEGLPASSFCTDQWKRITENQ